MAMDGRQCCGVQPILRKLQPWTCRSQRTDFAHILQVLLRRVSGFNSEDRSAAGNCSMATFGGKSWRDAYYCACVLVFWKWTLTPGILITWLVFPFYSTVCAHQPPRYNSTKFAIRYDIASGRIHVLSAILPSQASQLQLHRDGATG